MTEQTPILLIPGLLCSPRLYADQVPQLWRFGPVTIADHTRDDSMSAIAQRIRRVISSGYGWFPARLWRRSA
jgi:hypothetical protein